MRVSLNGTKMVCHYSNAVNWMTAQYADSSLWDVLGWDIRDPEAPAFIRKALGLRFV